jgi:hypothetical protein
MLGRTASALGIGRLVAIALAFLATACNTGSPASPTFESVPFVDATTDEVEAGEVGDAGTADP